MRPRRRRCVAFVNLVVSLLPALPESIRYDSHAVCSVCRVSYFVWTGVPLRPSAIFSGAISIRGRCRSQDDPSPSIHTPSPIPARSLARSVVCFHGSKCVQISYGEQSTSMYRAACSVYRIVPTLPSVPCRTRSPTRRLASSSTSRAQLEARLGSPLAHPTLNAQDHGHARSHPRLPRPRSRPRPRPSLPRAPHPLDRIIWPPGHHHHHPSPSSHPGPRSILDPRPRPGHLDITSPPCAVDRSGQPSAICHPAGAIIDGPSSLRSE